MTSVYADSPQAREVENRMTAAASTSGAADDWFADGPDEFTERCKAAEAKRLASLPDRLRLAMAQMELICSA
ncbi:hypothetical protein ACI2KS_10545 [Pseudomonas sp. NPDC087358]|uniref:hypothetical protein n=1 Tax=Pseudomonas sp. NPDC087358 TaxID=3364439 RepID=UPI00384F7471